MVDFKDIHPEAAGVAALSICESLLLALGDLKLLSDEEVIGVISDAADAHRFTDATVKDAALHQSVTKLLDRIIAGGNSVRRT